MTEPGTHFFKMDIRVGLFRRSYRVHVPRQYNPNAPTPLVVVIHGAFATAEEIETKTGFSILSDREGFIVVYPNGMGIFGLLQHWNAGHCCGRAANIDLDDVGFLQNVIEEVSGLLNVDRSRIYMVGHSNGGMLTYRFAAEKPEEIAAAAAVAASIGSWTEKKPLGWEMPIPQQPVPFIIFHGTADDDVPYAGGVSPRKGGDRRYVSVSDSVWFWLEANSCEKMSSRESLRRGAVTIESWTSPETGVFVRLYSLQNWAHTWPGIQLTRSLQDTDPLKDFDAAEIIWDFFQIIRSDPSRSLTGTATSPK